MELTLALQATVLITVALFSVRYVMGWIRFYLLASKIPGPKNIPLIGNVVWSINDFIVNNEKNVRDHPRYFSAWLGPVPMTVVLDARYVERVLASSKNHLNKPFSYNFLEPLCGTGVLTAKAEKWHHRRKLLSPAFHYKILENFIPVFIKKSQILVEKLKKEDGQNDFDIHSYVHNCTLDIIYETALGTPMTSMDEEKENDVAKAAEGCCEGAMHRIVSPWLYLDFIYWRSPSGRELRKNVDYIRNRANKVIQNRKQQYKQNLNSTQTANEFLGMKQRKVFLDLLLEVSQNNSFVDKDVIDEVATFIVAGFETVTSSICWMFHLLGNHEEVQDKVYNELQNIFQGTDRAPTLANLNEMKYLERVIKECLRLSPGVPIIGRRLSEDIKIDGYTIPKGMNMGIPIYYIHRNSEHFPEPEKFDPERFLPEKIASMHPYAYIPFGAGPRNCIGQKYAMLEMKIVSSYILRHYKFRSQRKTLTPVSKISLGAKEGFYVSLSSRNT